MNIHHIKLLECKPNLKFRPALTVVQLVHILDLIHCADLQSAPTKTPSNESIKKIIIPLLAKIEIDSITPAYKLSESHALKQAEKLERERYENSEMTAEEELEYETKILG
jgi:hypothetical protein